MSSAADRPSAFERLSTAVHTSDLTVDPDHRADADYVIALGLATSPGRHSAAASSLARLHLGAKVSDLGAAYRSVLAMVKRLNAKRNWRLNARAMHTVALQSLSHHVDPTCRHCHGRKFELREDSPVLSTKACGACHGTGRRPMQRRHREQISQLIAALESIDSITERAVARLVR